MGYVALIGLYFVPLLCLLGAAWSYVRYKNEHEDKERAEKDLRGVRICSSRLRRRWWSFWR